jgi:site-specific DNA recombinase
VANKRALKATRISVETDESTSIDRQDQVIETKIDGRGDVLVGSAEDRNVSAFKIAPFNRPSLGPWLNERVDEFDVLYFATQDRAIRSMKDLHELAAWAAKFGKEIVICEGPGSEIPLDFSAAANQQQQGVAMILLMVLAMASNLEVQAIKDRVKSSHRHLRRNGEWGGGVVPYGLMPERVANAKRGWKLVHNPETMDVLMEIVVRVVEGEKLLPICKDLTRRGIPTPRDYWKLSKDPEAECTRRWSVNTLKLILSSRLLLGEWVFEGLPNLDINGDPIPKCDPMISRSEWDDLQGALAALSMPTKQRYSEPNPLLGVAYCARCGQPYYLKQEKQKGHTYSNLSCRSRHGDQFTSCGQPTISLAYAVELTSAHNADVDRRQRSAAKEIRRRR